MCLNIINISDHCLPSQRASLRGSCRKAKQGLLPLRLPLLTSSLPPAPLPTHRVLARPPPAPGPLDGGPPSTSRPRLRSDQDAAPSAVSPGWGVTHATCPTPAQGTRPQPDAVPGCAGHQAGRGRPSLLCSGAEQTRVLGRDVIHGFVRSSLCSARGISRAAAGLLQINTK